MKAEAPVACRTATVLLFSRLREEVGTEALTVPVAEGSTAGSVLAMLSGQYAVIATNQHHLRLARNERLVPLTAPVQPGDTLALLLPVSGG